MSSIFLCHASEDKAIAEPIQLALTSAGCEVFYDEQSLSPGADYQARIRAAINNCDLFVFIASSASITAGRFTLTELKFVRERWPSPINRVLPVVIDGLKPRDLPNYLQAATVLTVSGNAAAEVRDAVESMVREFRRKRSRRWVAALVVCVALILSVVVLLRIGIGVTSVRRPPVTSSNDREKAMGEALELLNSGRFEQAIPAFESVVKIDPGNAQAYSYLGYALEASGHFDEAIAADRRAIELDGMNVMAHWNLGNSLYQKHDYEGAARSHRRALEISPSYTNAYIGLGNALMKLGREEEAKREFEKARDPSKRSLVITLDVSEQTPTGQSDRTIPSAWPSAASGKVPSPPEAATTGHPAEERFGGGTKGGSSTEICSCTGRGGVDGVTLWGPKGEPCGGMVTGDTKPWGTYSSSCRVPKEIGKCTGEGGVKNLELWGPSGEVCGGLWENKAKYSLGKRKASDVRLCSCKGYGGVEGVTLWGPEGDLCAGIADDNRWGTYNADCR